MCRCRCVNFPERIKVQCTRTKDHHVHVGASQRAMLPHWQVSDSNPEHRFLPPLPARPRLSAACTTFLRVNVYVEWHPLSAFQRGRFAPWQHFSTSNRKESVRSQGNRGTFSPALALTTSLVCLRSHVWGPGEVVEERQVWKQKSSSVSSRGVF